MEMNALLMDETDNVVTCVTEVSAGQDVVYRKGSTVCTLKAEEDIPYCHKIALEDLEEGAEVRKYGELIGRTNQRIKRGCWIAHHNIFSVPRDYAGEMAEE